MVPKGWKITSLGKICSGNLQTGPFGSQLHAHEYTKSGVPVLMPKDLIGYRANITTAAKIPQSRADDLAKHKLKVGDILFSRRGDVARFALIDEKSKDALCGTGCLKATVNADHSSFFLSYFLQKNAVRKWLEQNAVGQTMPNMNTAILNELPLMVASSKKEEERIAKILSTWDKAISTTEALIDNSKQQKKALMQQLLTGKKRFAGFGEPAKGDKLPEGWTLEPIGNYIFEHRGGAALKPIDFRDSGFTVLPKKAVQLGNRLKIGEPTYCSNSFAEANSRSMVDKSFSVITLRDLVPTGPTIGTVVNYYTDEKYILAQGVYGLKLKEEISREFLAYLSNFQLYRKLMNKVMVGSTQVHIRVSEYLTLKFQFPTNPEQKKIATVLINADKEIELLQKQLADLKQEKKALMQQLLTGKRRVKINESEAALA